jgi:hypothetical protein
MVIINKFRNPKNPGIEPENPGNELALKPCGIPGFGISGLDSLVVKLVPQLHATHVCILHLNYFLRDEKMLLFT